MDAPSRSTIPFAGNGPARAATLRRAPLASFAPRAPAALHARLAAALVALLSTLGVALAASAFSPVPPPPPPTMGAEIYGTVCATPEGAVASSDTYCEWATVPEATVTLAGPGDHKAETVADRWGGFMFSGAPSGSATLTAQRAGFGSATRTVWVEGYTQVALHLAASTVDATGIVQDPDGQPVAGASVSVCCPDGATQDVTGADGTFVVRVPAGLYTFDLGADGYRAAHPQRIVDGSAPLVLTLHPLPAQDAVLQGQVVDQNGVPVAGAYVFAQPQCCWQPPAWDTSEPCQYDPWAVGCDGMPDALPGNGTMTDEAGRYWMRVHGGWFDVRVELADAQPFYGGTEVQAGGTTSFDITVVRYPARTAHLEGRVVDARNGHAVAGYSMEAHHPELGRRECSQTVLAGTNATWGGMAATATASPVAATSYAPHPVAMSLSPPSPGYSYEGCRIALRPDGSFEAWLTPGYTVLSIWPQQSCNESRDADGNARTQCTPAYFRHQQSLVLLGNGTASLLVELASRPPADAIVSGYLVDTATGKAIAGGHVSFNNEGMEGYGYARTDADGSFRIRLRAGYHTVTANAPGYFDWQGTVTVASGENPFDVPMHAGSPQGWQDCCWDRPRLSPVVPPPPPPPVVAPPMPIVFPATPVTPVVPEMPAPAVDVSVTPMPPAVPEGTGEGSAYVDLGGGLGPYNPEARNAVLEGQDAQPVPASVPSPAAAVAAIAALAGAAAVLLRRRR